MQSAEREAERRAKHKFAALRHAEKFSGSVAATCRHYGITKACSHKWRRHYEDEGFEGRRLVTEDAARFDVGWVTASPVSPRAVYRGVVEHSIYVASKARG